MNIEHMKIGIIGGGFCGTALAAVLRRLSAGPIEVVLCDKSGSFGAGPAYSTPFDYHLLNVRAQDMSAFEDKPAHFTDWVTANPDRLSYFDQHKPLGEQFAPRKLYYDYLQWLIKDLCSDHALFKITFESAEVIDVEARERGALLVFSDQRRIPVDKVILAMGNHLPASFPFPLADDIQRIANPWDYQAVNDIPKDAPVLIIGTGLSMIDAVLTLHHQQHKGAIYAVSRHGLLPLPHADNRPAHPLDAVTGEQSLRVLTAYLRRVSESHSQEGGDWRSIINSVRTRIPDIWQKMSLVDKKRFLRHMVSYWNIHRHRVHTTIMDLLTQMSEQGQLVVMSGRVQSVQSGLANIQLRHGRGVKQVPVKWVINCMGPTQTFSADTSPLVKALLRRDMVSLDALQLGLNISPLAAETMYALGAPTKGATWEIGAVPELRRQIFALARHLLARR